MEDDHDGEVSSHDPPYRSSARATAAQSRAIR
jgi:hypothetical protein